MMLHRLHHAVCSLPARIIDEWRYRRSLATRSPAGSIAFRSDFRCDPDPPLVELRVVADGHGAVSIEDARAWAAHQTLRELRVVATAADGATAWRIDPDHPSLRGARAAWFAAPGGLPEVPAAQLESCLLVAAAENIDAVVIDDRSAVSPVDDIDAVHGAAFRSRALFRTGVYDWDPGRDRVRPVRERRLAKIIDRRGVAGLPRSPAMYHRRRRGPYVASYDLPAVLRVGLRDASLLGRTPAPDDRPAVLVTAPFLARGGAEQTLHATLAALAPRFRFTIATLAPHRPELGDRRDDFLAITDRIFPLGDLVHPDAMPGILLALLDAEGAEILYNANGTTLFYEFAPALKAARPGLRIIDHLYDHRIGYIDAYVPGVDAAVDVCIAENRPISDVLVHERGWDPSRAPVIHPCGRPVASLPPEADRPAIRARLRAELGFADGDIVLLTAARMHEQKRPLDLVALAERVRDLARLHFLLVGGGDLEDEVDAAIAAAAGARIRRLGFRTDVLELIVAADAGCLVSEHEGLPVFMIECLQLGRPFLGTRVGDLGAVLDDTGAGLVVDRPGDLDALEEAARDIADDETRDQLARRAVAAARRFSVDACAAAYARAFTGES